MTTLDLDPRTAQARIQIAIDTCNDALFAQYNAPEPDEALIEVLEAALDRLMAEAATR